ncbi:hypothetical protein F5I97DRAFT_1872700 [Phlebopus sp. FC_14]|nr:hypothetical protein F5I97DRAFT_1872700 [Phlebopus sp. FC_14]
MGYTLALAALCMHVLSVECNSVEIVAMRANSHGTSVRCRVRFLPFTPSHQNAELWLLSVSLSSSIFFCRLLHPGSGSQRQAIDLTPVILICNTAIPPKFAISPS